MLCPVVFLYLVVFFRMVESLEPKSSEGLAPRLT